MRRGKNDPDRADSVVGWEKTQLALAAKMRVERLSPLPRFLTVADAAFSEDKEKVFAAGWPAEVATKSRYPADCGAVYSSIFMGGDDTGEDGERRIG